MKRFMVNCRENGDCITEFESMAEAETCVEKFGRDDMIEEVGYVDKKRVDEYERFYEIVELEDCHTEEDEASGIIERYEMPHRVRDMTFDGVNAHHTGYEVILTSDPYYWNEFEDADGNLYYGR